MEVLEGFVSGLYKKLVVRRPAITTFSQQAVWDCFGVEEGFTKDIHITIAIHEDYHDISLTIPNSANIRWKRLKHVFSETHLETELFRLLKDLRAKVPNVFLEFNQRHFIAMRKGVNDAYLEFNIDTYGLPFRPDKSKVKEFPIWFNVLKDAVNNKRRINGQVMFKVRFYFNETPDIDKPKFLSTARSTIQALKPLFDFLVDNPNSESVCMLRHAESGPLHFLSCLCGSEQMPRSLASLIKFSKLPMRQ